MSANMTANGLYRGSESGVWMERVDELGLCLLFSITCSKTDGVVFMTPVKMIELNEVITELYKRLDSKMTRWRLHSMRGKTQANNLIGLEWRICMSKDKARYPPSLLNQLKGLMEQTYTKLLYENNKRADKLNETLGNLSDVIDDLVEIKIESSQKLREWAHQSSREDAWEVVDLVEHVVEQIVERYMMEFQLLKVISNQLLDPANKRSSITLLMILWTAEPYLDDSETDLLEEIKNLKENLQIEPNADEKEHSSHCTKDLLASLFDV